MTEDPAGNHQRRKRTTTLPGAQYVGIVESKRLPQSAAALRQADPTFDRHFQYWPRWSVVCWCLL
jgi:hypothetical protein